MHIILSIIGWALIVIAIIAKLGNKKLRWRDASITAVLGIIVVVIGSSIGPHATKAPNSTSANSHKSVKSKTQSTPQFVFTDTGGLSADYNQIIDDSKTGNFYTIKKDISDAQKDLNSTKSDLKSTTQNLHDSGLPDLVTRYQLFLNTMSKVVKSGLAGDLNNEQKELSTATDQGAYIATEMEVILTPNN